MTTRLKHRRSRQQMPGRNAVARASSFAPIAIEAPRRRRAADSRILAAAAADAAYRLTEMPSTDLADRLKAMPVIALQAGDETGGTTPNRRGSITISIAEPIGAVRFQAYIISLIATQCRQRLFSVVRRGLIQPIALAFGFAVGSRVSVRFSIFQVYNVILLDLIPYRSCSAMLTKPPRL
jgi:hypothetical protein